MFERLFVFLNTVISLALGESEIVEKKQEKIICNVVLLKNKRGKVDVVLGAQFGDEVFQYIFIFIYIKIINIYFYKIIIIGKRQKGCRNCSKI